LSVALSINSAAEVLSSTVLPGDKAKLGLVGKYQEDATTHDDAVIPYHLWNSRLKILWDGDVLPPSDVTNAAELIREKFPLWFWKIKMRKSFFVRSSQLYKVHVLYQNMVAWDGANYVWKGNYKGQYAHYWRAMWGQKENDKQKSLLAAGDCIKREANSTWWNWKIGPGLSSRSGAKSIVGISRMGLLCGTGETLQCTLLLNERRRIQNLERTWEQS
jgi:hypothetical protein